MGEETKQEQPPAETQPEEKAEEKPEEDKKEEPPAPPQPPPPFVLYVDLHCMGCAKKIEKSIMKIRGVEGVVIDMAQNQVTIKGIIEPQAVCAKIMKKTKRRAKVLSPLPAAEGETIPEVVVSQVSGLATVELNVDMHCQACAEQLKRKILKMRGVQTAVTEHSTGKVIVTGTNTIDANKLVDYVYRRTKKQARIVPQPEPEPKPEPQPEPVPEKQEEKKEEEEKPAEAKPEENPPEEAKPGENAEKKEEKPPEEAKPEENTEKKEETPPEETDKTEVGENKEEDKKAAAVEPEENNVGTDINTEDDTMKRMVYYYQPLYMIERMPPAPQLFSDENPNACCIS